MKKWKVTWYNVKEIVKVDVEPVSGETTEEATRNAYLRYNGNPPAEFLMLEEMK